MADTPTLPALNDAVRRANDVVFGLHHGSTPQAFTAAADALSAALAIARDLSRPNGPTGCQRHPQGAVDPADDGCLICNIHRARANRPATAPTVRHRTTARPPDPPSPAYTAAAAAPARLPDLGTALIERARADLGDDAPYEELVIHAHRRATVRPADAHTRRKV